MLQEQTGRLSHLAEILLDMTGLQTVERSDTISLAALTEEVFCDLDPVADKHQIRLIQTEGDCTVTGSYIPSVPGSAIIWLKMRSNITGLPVPLL